MTIKISIKETDRKAFLRACQNMGSTFQYKEKDLRDGNYEYIVHYESRYDLFSLGQFYGIELRGADNWETR